MSYPPMDRFPIPLENYKHLSIDPWAQEKLTPELKAALQANIDLCRAAIVFFTACGSASGYGGHTGGAFDTVPEVMILDAIFRGPQAGKFVPIFFDEAGHRVATQYLMSVLRGHMDAKELRYYRAGHKKLPGHPELGLTPGVEFSGGRLGHMWSFVNGVQMANPDKICIMLGSDGSQQEGDDAEAARLCVAQNLKVKLFVDDNDVTIAGHPSEYMKGFSVANTLKGHGMPLVLETNGEDLDALYTAMRNSIVTPGPTAVIAYRKMAPTIEGVEGTTNGHDAVAVKYALPYLESRGYTEAATYIKGIKKGKDDYQYLGSGKRIACRKEFGKVVNGVLDKMSVEERVDRIKVFDCDLEGSTGLNVIGKEHPEVYVKGGIMERGNFSSAAGFGMQEGRTGVMSTFSAFLEMCISEITMARLNYANVLCHFSHSGVDDMADNTCHFGLNNMFADNGLEDGHETSLYFPADAHQMKHVVEATLLGKGLRFIFSNRSSIPEVLTPSGALMFGDDYKWTRGKDDLIREGTQGYIVAYGDGLYRALDAVERLKQQGISVGLVSKTTLNVPDEAMLKKLGASKFVLCVDIFNVKTGVGAKMGSWLMERGMHPKFKIIGTHHEGSGGLWHQAYHQGYDPKSIMDAVKSLSMSSKL